MLVSVCVCVCVEVGGGREEHRQCESGLGLAFSSSQLIMCLEQGWVVEAGGRLGREGDGCAQMSPSPSLMAQNLLVTLKGLMGQ